MVTPLTVMASEEVLLLHICEVCGVEEELTSEQGYQKGWDYPPKFYPFTVLGPRTCGNCGIDKTLWWRLTTNPDYKIVESDLELVERVQAEPESIMVK